MKLKYLIFFVIYVLGFVYLALPSPSYPDLSDAIRSTEAGDTWQNPDQKGFYTDLSRAEVLSQLQSKFTLKIFGLTIPSFRLNYRPEEAFTLVRDQLNSNYLEEIVYPFRESLFVNGWEPKNDPRFRNLPAKGVPVLAVNGRPYLSKVTLKPVYSSLWARLLVWTLIFPGTYLTYFSIKRALSKNV